MPRELDWLLTDLEIKAARYANLFSLASLSSLEEAELWYRQKYPSLPDEYHGIMARYSFWELLTKKELKNTYKKYKKKNKDLPVGLQIKTGTKEDPIKVIFD